MKTSRVVLRRALLLTLCLDASRRATGHSSKAVQDASYEAYEARQASKILNASAHMLKYINKFDQGGRKALAQRFERHPAEAHLVQDPVLAVGARLGGEVQAFQSLPHVSLAIGVDVAPGEKNAHVLYGDAHTLSQFKAGAFGTVYSNVLDHILHIDRFAAAAHRVLRPNGAFLHLLTPCAQSVSQSSPSSQHGADRAPHAQPIRPIDAHVLPCCHLAPLPSGTLFIDLPFQPLSADNFAVHDLVVERQAILTQLRAPGFSEIRVRTASPEGGARHKASNYVFGKV